PSICSSPLPVNLFLYTTLFRSPGYYQGYANVLLGNGAGGMASPNVTVLNSGFHNSAAVADFNGDGKLDLATANSDYGAVGVLPEIGRAHVLTPVTVRSRMPSSA